MRFGITKIIGVSLGLTVLATSAPALAEPPGPNTLPIAVTTIKTEESDALADALTSALKSAVRASKGWSLADGDYSLEVLSLALRCPTPPDAACEVRIADKIMSDRFIWGTIDANEKGDKAVGTLHLWIRGKGETSVPLSYSANLTEPQDDSLLAVVRDALQTLTGGPPKGSVKIKAGDVNGQVFVDGKPAGAIQDGSATVFVPVGTHKIEVRALGYSDSSANIDVSPTKSVEVKLEPVPKEDEGAGVNVKQIATYGAFGLSGIMLAAGVYSSLKVNSINVRKNDILNNDPNPTHSNPTGDDICSWADQNKDSDARASKIAEGCSTGSTMQVLQFVFYGLSAASAGAGAYLLMSEQHSDDSSSTNESVSRRIRVVPSVGQNNGYVSVQVSF